MLSNLANYLLGYGESVQVDSEEGSTSPKSDDNVRLTTVETDEDDWLMVETNNGLKSRRSSTASLPCFSMEESWFVTPPPCFTSTGPITLETSPLENLLIEHPSMSVYHRSDGPITRQQRARSLSPIQPNPNHVRPRHRVPLQPYQVQNMQVQAFKAQKQKSIKESQVIKPKQLEKNNKVREVNKRNKKQRRSDRQKNHSGANNNRKC